MIRLVSFPLGALCFACDGLCFEVLSLATQNFSLAKCGNAGFRDSLGTENNQSGHEYDEKMTFFISFFSVFFFLLVILPIFCYFPFLTKPGKLWFTLTCKMHK